MDTTNRERCAASKPGSRPRRLRLAHLAVPFACAGFVACGGEGPGASAHEEHLGDRCACGQVGVDLGAPATADIGVSTQALYADRWGMFPAAWSDPTPFRTDVPVCWENPDSTEIGSTTWARSAWRDSRRRALEESWGRHARINFTGFGTCTANSGGLRIVICNNPDARCPAMPSSQSAGDYPEILGMNDGIRLNPAHSEAIIVHEIGHALGFFHAEERENTVDNLGATACDPSSSGWSNDDPVTYGGYDEDSIMAYCSPPTATPWLSPTDVAGVQRAYGRRQAGSLVTPRAKCAAAHQAVGHGDRAFLWDCDEYGNDQEYYDISNYTSGDRFNLKMPGANLCLEPWSNASGAQVKLRSCGSQSNTYSWRFQDMSVQGFGGLCLDLQGGSTSSGTPIQVWECGALSGANQQWTRTRAGLLRYRTTDMCARVSGGYRLRLYPCNAGDTFQRFSFQNGAVRLMYYPTLCLDVQGPSDAQFFRYDTDGSGHPHNGAAVQAFGCNGSMNQRWNFRGPMRLGANSNLCLARGSDRRGSGLSVATCNGSVDRQEWDYYF